MADHIGELLVALPGFMAGLIAGLIAGALASKFGASNLVAGFVGIAVFLVTFLGVNVWHVVRRERPPHSN